MIRHAAQMSPEELSIQDAYQEGARCGQFGTAAGLNPYQCRTPEYDAWERGRMAAILSKLRRVA